MESNPSVQDSNRRRELAAVAARVAVPAVAATAPAVAAGDEAQPNLFVREAQTLLSRHELHTQCIAELMAVAERAPDSTSSLPTLLRELGGWHDRLVRELVTLVKDCARESELKVRQAQVRADPPLILNFRRHAGSPQPDLHWRLHRRAALPLTLGFTR